MPSSASHVSTERTRTRSMLGSSRSSAISSSPMSVSARLDHRAVGQRDVVEQRPTEQLGLEVRATRRRVRDDVLDPDAEVGAAVVLADDELLRDVDETTGEVARVGGAECGVDETLAGARRGDEVLEHLEAFTEVRLDRAGDHVAARVGHEAAHAGDLRICIMFPRAPEPTIMSMGLNCSRLELLSIASCTSRGGLGPDAHFLLTALAVGDDAAAELGLDLLGLRLVVVEDAFFFSAAS